MPCLPRWTVSGGIHRVGIPAGPRAMAKHSAKSQRESRTVASLDASEACIPEDTNPAKSDAIQVELALVRSCISGDVAAWENLYNHYHPALQACIELMLDSARRDASLVDEISARVWYALIANDGELLERFDPSRGVRLITFFRAIAKDEISRFFRSERRRRDREVAALRSTSRPAPAAQDQDDQALSDFLTTLTPHERGFADAHLLRSEHPQTPDSPESPEEPSPASMWQLTCRIRRKLLDFLRQ